MKTQSEHIAPQDYGNNRATYCPEDNKLRLYVGRVPRDEYEALRAEGWTSTPKQDCDFVAVWTPARRDTALSYAGVIEDEDMSPADRAADRAERFAGYREKRREEATADADRYDSQPSAYGFQSQARAERAARRFDAIAARACDAWSKAEYWQRRTAGVISHALHTSTPAVRMGRIKELEAELRKMQKTLSDRLDTWKQWKALAEMTDAEAQTAKAQLLAGFASYSASFHHPRPEAFRAAILASDKPKDPASFADYMLKERHSLYSLLTSEYLPITGAEAAALYLGGRTEPPAEGNDWTRHLQLRLAYEHQMLEAQGGRAAFVEMEPGGWIGGHQIHKVTKSPATGRVVSVELRYMSRADRWGNAFKDGKERELSHLVNVERLPADAYRAPTDEERAAFAAKVSEEKQVKAQKTKEKAEAGENCPLINPTDEDAERLQAMFAEKHAKDPWHRGEAAPTVERTTQAVYSANSKGTFARAEAVTICEDGTPHRTKGGRKLTRCDVFKVRMHGHRVIILTDKPQKPIPWDRIAKARAKCPTVESMTPRLEEIAAAIRTDYRDRTESQKLLLADAEYLGWYWCSSMCQYGFTEQGQAAYAAYTALNSAREEAAV